MFCRHCGEEIEPRLSDDPAARCPACDQRLADAPIDFQPVEAFAAEDIDAVERVVETLHRRTPELFLLPERTTPPTIPIPTATPSHEPASSTLPSPSWPPVLPTLPVEVNRGFALNWMFIGVGIAAFACGGVLVILATTLVRNDLWSAGFPMLLGGQGSVIFGLVGLLETQQQRTALWQAALQEHREQLQRTHQHVIHSPTRRAA